MNINARDGKDVHGEKQWQEWAQWLEDYGIEHENLANDRIPYQSALMLDAMLSSKGEGHDGLNAGSEAYEITPTEANIVAGVKGEKQWQEWAQDLEDYGVAQEDVANSRIPY